MFHTDRLLTQWKSRSANRRTLRRRRRTLHLEALEGRLVLRVCELNALFCSPT